MSSPGTLAAQVHELQVEIGYWHNGKCALSSEPGLDVDLVGYDLITCPSGMSKYDKGDAGRHCGQQELLCPEVRHTFNRVPSQEGKVPKLLRPLICRAPFRGTGQR